MRMTYQIDAIFHIDCIDDRILIIAYSIEQKSCISKKTWNKPFEISE